MGVLRVLAALLAKDMLEKCGPSLYVYIYICAYMYMYMYVYIYIHICTEEVAVGPFKNPGPTATCSLSLPLSVFLSFFLSFRLWGREGPPPPGHQYPARVGQTRLRYPSLLQDGLFLSRPKGHGP